MNKQGKQRMAPAAVALAATGLAAVALAWRARQSPPAVTPAAQTAARPTAPVSRTAQTSRAAQGFRPALPGYRYSFPRDHAAHPQFSTEWWYYTGHLRGRNGRRFGYQLTWFRQALAPRMEKRASKWAARDIVFAHFALTDETGQKFFFTDRIARAALHLAGAETQTPHVWLGDWSLRFGANDVQHLRAAGASDNADTAGTTFALDLTQRPLKPPVVHGQNGVSQKAQGRGRASHYVSLARLQTRGVLRLGQERLEVEGQSWFDHEFGSNQLAPGQVGWDWFSLQLDDGRELMLYRMRLQNGGTDPFSSGTLIEKDGRARHLKASDFRIEGTATWRSPFSNAVYPARWQLALDSENIALQVEPTVAAQELRARRSSDITYWEGSVQVRGTANGQAVRGQGYVELTGYDRPFNRTF